MAKGRDGKNVRFLRLEGSCRILKGPYEGHKRCVMQLSIKTSIIYIYNNYIYTCIFRRPLFLRDRYSAHKSSPKPDFPPEAFFFARGPDLMFEEYYCSAACEIRFSFFFRPLSGSFRPFRGHFCPRTFRTFS